MDKRQTLKQTCDWKQGILLLLPAILPALVTLIAYLPSLHNGFVNFDDPGYVYENPFIKTIDPRSLKAFLTTPFVANWHPLTMLSYAIDYSIWGSDPFGYHLTNIVFHTLNTFLVALLARRLSSAARQTSDKIDIFTGLTAALFFGLHPLRVESVAWISERKDVLYAFFFLLSVFSYISYTREKRRYSYYLTVLFFILSLMSKPMAISLPLVLLVLDIYPLKRLFPGPGAPIAEKAPLFAIGTLSAILTLWAQNSAMTAGEALGLKLRIIMALRAPGFYLYKMLMPVDLIPYYPYTFKALSPGVIIPMTFVLLITLFCAATFKRRPVFLAAWLYYIFTLAPVLGIVQVGAQAAADRYTYLPCLGPVLLISAAIGHMVKRTGFLAPGIVVLALSAALMFLTAKQIPVWKDSITLWSYEIKKGMPDSGVKIGEKDALFVPAIMAYYNRALAFDSAGDYKMAIRDYDKAITLNPGYINAYVNRGIIYGKTGDYEKAIDDFNEAIRIDPNDRDPYFNRGLVYTLKGDKERADDDFRRAAILMEQKRGR